ncbi:MAG: endolytic transglycosylase MltG [Patescibacteria group bacterium]
MVRRIILGIVAAILVAGISLVIIFFRLTGAPGPLAEAKQVTIVSGMGVKLIAQQLQADGVIARPFIFETTAALDGVRSSFQAGTFTIPARVSVSKVIEILTTKPDADEVTVRIPEDVTAKEIAAILEQAGVLSASDFFTAVETTDSRTVAPDSTYDFLRDKPTTANLEGYLFPDTYRFFKRATPAHVVKKFLDNFEAKVASTVLGDIRASGHTVFEVVTLASIVDKEVRTDTDRRIAAGIFWKRIEIGMALQSDATVNYVTGKQALQPTNVDLSVGSPYNTYQNRGLPPGPIGNPSLSAIRAVANPEASPYLYFLHKPDGTTVFSKTYEEHVANKQKYL